MPKLLITYSTWGRLTWIRRKTCWMDDRYTCVRYFSSSSDSVPFFFQTFKKSKVMTIIGVIKPHMDGITKHHPKVVEFIHFVFIWNFFFVAIFIYEKWWNIWDPIFFNIMHPFFHLQKRVGHSWIYTVGSFVHLQVYPEKPWITPSICGDNFILF